MEPDLPRDSAGRGRRVSIHGLAWSPTFIRFSEAETEKVSIHGLAWSPTAWRSWPALPALFQSTGSRGARRRLPRRGRSPGKFQSTGSRGARLRVQLLTGARPGVSIHGLAWSPTFAIFCAPVRFGVSIHGLAWSPTREYQRDRHHRRFQSTGSRGARRGCVVGIDIGIGVSIHGLAWSPTQKTEISAPARFGFNPRARVEPDLSGGRHGTAGRLFQSTGSRGARLFNDEGFRVPKGFQSTGSRGARPPVPSPVPLKE